MPMSNAVPPRLIPGVTGPDGAENLLLRFRQSDSIDSEVGASFSEIFDCLDRIGYFLN